MTNNNTANLDKKNDIKKFQKCLVIREISSKFATFFRLYKRSRCRNLLKVKQMGGCLNVCEAIEELKYKSFKIK